MTVQVLKVLEAVLQDPAGHHYGFELCRATGLKSGTLYPILARLEQAGWLESRWEELDRDTVGRPPRRLYRLTGLGEEAARRELAAVPGRSLKTLRPNLGATLA